MISETDIQELGKLLTGQGLRLACAESCTGGLAGHTLTGVSGSSDWFRGGVIAYSNEVKSNVLGVDENVLHRHGAVSEPVVEALAKNICTLMNADAGFGISGVAGPTGGTPEKPVGTVWIGYRLCDARGERTWAEKHLFPGTRSEIKEQSAAAAIRGMLNALRNREKRS